MTTNLHELAHHALPHLLAGTPVTLTHVRPPGFPLPIKRMPDNPDGTVTQSYRAIAVLEYIGHLAPVSIASPAIKLIALPPLKGLK